MTTGKRNQRLQSTNRLMQPSYQKGLISLLHVTTQKIESVIQLYVHEQMIRIENP